MSEENRITKELITHLDENNIAYYIHRSSIRIPLPNDFGELQIDDLENDDDIIGLVGEKWHTHSDLLLDYYNTTSKAELICSFVKDIIKGDFLLIEEFRNGKSLGRQIDHKESFKIGQPKDITIKIYNDI